MDPFFKFHIVDYYNRCVSVVEGTVNKSSIGTRVHDLHIVVSDCDSESETKNDCDLAGIVSFELSHVKLAV